MDASSLFFGILFSSIGLAYLAYGKKQKSIVPKICGMLLVAVTFMISDTTLLLIVGVVLTAMPYFLKGRF